MDANTKRLKLWLATAICLFLLYISNLFIFRVILVALLALTIGHSSFFQNIQEKYKELYTIALGLMALILAIATVYSEISVIYGITGYMLFHPDVTWALIPIVLLLVFTNIIELPLISNATGFLKKKYIKVTVVILLLLLASISVFWESSYRTLRDDDEFINCFKSMSDDLQSDIFREYNNYSIYEAFTTTVAVNIITLVQSVLRYKVANIYLTYVTSFWYGRNYTLIALSVGVIIESCFTVTRLNLIKGISLDYNVDIKTNVTTFKERHILSYYYSAHLYAFSRIFISIFNQSQVTIAENLTANWFFRSVKLYDNQTVKFPEDLIVGQSLNVTFSVSNGIWRSASERMMYKPQQLIVVDIPHIMFFDALTSIEFYKYEIEAIAVILIALYWSHPLISKFKKFMEDFLKTFKASRKQKEY